MEPSLALTKEQYEIEYADLMGWGRDPDSWSEDDLGRIRMDGGSALRRFYQCFPPHDWSFLRQQISLTLASGASTVALPDDYGGVEGAISVSRSGESMRSPIVFGNPMFVKMQHDGSPDQTGRPQIASVRSLKPTQPNKGQQSQIYVFPTSDQSYVLTFQYYMNQNYLADVAPYAYGGAEHSETILQSYLAVAEERRLNIPKGSGPHGMAFQERLLVSQALDRRKKPQWIGTNRDFSDGPETRNLRGVNSGLITINGVEYD